MRAPSRATVLSLAGAAVLAGFCVAAVPFSRGLFRAPRTPYDASGSDFTVAAWIVLTQAQPVIPRGESVVVRIEPPNPWTDTYLHRFAVALLPGRTIIPAARWGTASEPAILAEADYEVVVGRPETPPPGEKLVEVPEGGVWRR